MSDHPCYVCIGVVPHGAPRVLRGDARGLARGSAALVLRAIVRVRMDVGQPYELLLGRMGRASEEHRRAPQAYGHRGEHGHEVPTGARPVIRV